MQSSLNEVVTKKMNRKNAANQQPEIWAITSGKGGVGKTFITSSLAISLTKLGHSVTIVDLDLTGANVHTALGMNPSFLNIRQFFEGSKSLQELVIPTAIPHLSYIQGFWDSWGPTDFRCESVQKIIPELKKLRSDFVFVDLGAGAIEGHLELFRSADEKILVTTPEPSSIEKTYRFLEAHLCYSIKQETSPEAYQNLISTLRLHRQRSLTSPFSFKSYFNENQDLKGHHFEQRNQKQVRLIVNQSRSHMNDELGYSIKSVCNKYYQLSVDYVGAIHYDNAVWQSAKMKDPVLIAQPFTPLAGQFLAACKHLIDHTDLRAVV